MGSTLLVLITLVSGLAQEDALGSRLERALALVELGKNEEAEALLAGVLAADPSNAQAHYLMGRLALQAARLEEAEEHLRAAAGGNAPRPFLVLFSLGRLHLLKRQYAEAREAFTQSLARAPRFAPALTGRARALLFLGDSGGGKADLDAALALPDPPAEASSLRRDLDYLLGQQGVGPALLAREVELRLVLSEDPADARAHLALAAHYAGQGEREKAMRSVAVAQELDDQNPVSFLMAKKVSLDAAGVPSPYPEVLSELQSLRAAVTQGRDDDAVKIARRILERRPRFIPARLALIEIAEKRKDLVAALREYDELVRLLPPLPSLHAGIAKIAAQMGAYDLAECHARKALADRPEDGALHYLLGSAQAGAGKTEDALDSFRRAIDSGLSTAAVYFSLGNVHYSRMEIAQSIAALRMAVELDPEAAENIASFALSSLTTEDYARLRELLERHVRSHPENVNTLYSLGVMSLRDGELAKARSYLEQVKAAKPEEAEVHYNLALIYSRQGDAGKAVQAMSRFQALRTEQDRLWLEASRAQLERHYAKEALARGDLEKAATLYSRLVEGSAREPSDVLGLSRALVGAGRFKEAERWLDGLLREAPHPVEALEMMALVLERLGKTEEARPYRSAVGILTRPCS